MKLKTKLIPLASVAAVCATVAPITLTSCGSNTYVDLLDNFVPSFDKLKQEYDPAKGFTYDMSELDESKLVTPPAIAKASATEAWTKLMIEHPEYFAQEYYWTTSNAVKTVNQSRSIDFNRNMWLVVDILERVRFNELTYRLPQAATLVYAGYAQSQYPAHYATSRFSTTYKTYQEKISDFKINTQKFIITYYNKSEAKTNLEFEIPTISYRLDFNRVAESSFSEDNSQWTYTSTDVGYKIFENVPVIVLNDYNPVVESPSFVVSPFIRWIMAGKDGGWFTGKLQEALDQAGKLSTTQREVTVNSPAAWSVTCYNDQTEKGVKSNISGDHNYVWSNAEKIILDSESMDKTNKVMSMQMLAELQVLTASWYLFSVNYTNGYLSDSLIGPEIRFDEA